MEAMEEHLDKKEESSNRREFLQTSFAAAIGFAAAAAASPLRASTQTDGAKPTKHLVLKKPISGRLVKSSTKKTGAVTESDGVVELTGATGNRYVSDCHNKRVQHEGGHEDTTVIRIEEYASSSDSAPALSYSRTIVASVTYGELHEGIRRDQVSVRVFDDEGEHVAPALIVKVPVPGPSEELSDQELVDKMLAEKFGQ